MGIRLAWTDSNTAEDGYNVYRHTASMAGLTDTQLATYLLATLPADATEYKDGTAVDGTTYFYLVATRSGSVLVRGTEVEVTAADTSGGGGADFSTAQVGDEIGGGIYAGTITYADARQFHIVVSLPAYTTNALAWGTYDNAFSGADDPDDGMANLQHLSSDLVNHPMFEYCANLSAEGHDDWYPPAKNELGLVYDNLRNHASMSDVTNVWASTEFEGDDGYAYLYLFPDFGIRSNINKTTTSTGVYTRPIRRVPV